MSSEKTTGWVDALVKIVQVISIVAGVVFSVLSFNSAQEKEAAARIEEARKSSIEAAKPFLQIRQALYTETVQQAAILSNPTDHTPQELKKAKKRFRELYVAELSMVESQTVEASMTAMAQEVDPDLLDLTDTQKAAYKLSHDLRDSLIRSWDVDQKILDNTISNSK